MRWWLSITSFLILVTYNKSLFFRGSILSDYRFMLPLLYDVLPKTVKIYQKHNPWYILLKEVPHGFTLTCNHHQGIDHSRSLLLRLRHTQTLNMSNEEWKLGFINQYPRKEKISKSLWNNDTHTLQYRRGKLWQFLIFMELEPLPSYFVINKTQQTSNEK